MFELLNKILAIPTAFAQNNAEGASNVASRTGSQLENLVDVVVRSIPLWITGGIVIIISFVLSRVVKNAVENKMTAEGFEEEHREIQIVSGRAASAAVLTLGITAGLKVAGLDLTPIIAAAAFGIGFAMQDIIMNFLAGIIVLLQKQFTIGDWIKVNGTTGIVMEIQSRYTVLKKFDGTKVIIPNAELFKNQVTSLTSNQFRRFQIDIAVDLYYDLKEVIDLIYKSINKVDKIVQKPKPNVIVTQPGKSYNNLRIRCWVESKKGVLKPISSLVRQIHKDFYRRGWSWPYPTQTVVFDKDMEKDIKTRSKHYVETHPKKVKKEEGHLQKELQNLAQQEQQPAVQPANQGSQNNAATAPNPPLVVTIGPEVKQYQTTAQNNAAAQPEQAQPANLTLVPAPVVIASSVQAAAIAETGSVLPLPDVQPPQNLS